MRRSILQATPRSRQWSQHGAGRPARKWPNAEKYKLQIDAFNRARRRSACIYPPLIMPSWQHGKSRVAVRADTSGSSLASRAVLRSCRNLPFAVRLHLDRFSVIAHGMHGQQGRTLVSQASRPGGALLSQSSRCGAGADGNDAAQIEPEQHRYQTSP